MNWIKDKKNIKIVVALLTVIVIAAVWFIVNMANGNGGDTSAQVAATPAPAPAATPPGAPPQVGQNPVTSPVVQPAVPAAVKPPVKVQTAVKPKSAKLPAAKPKAAVDANGAAATATDANIVASAANGPDPFKLPNSPALKKQQAAPPIPVSTTYQIPSPVIATVFSTAQKRRRTLPMPTTTVASNSARRVSGIVYNDGVYAILETSGVSRTVQPGDTVDGGRVISIQPDSITLRMSNDQTIKVPLSSTSTGADTNVSAFGGGPPAGYGGPPAGYGGPPAGYGGPPAGYGGPPAGYGGPPAGYGGPPAGYGGPPSGYDGNPSQ